MSWVFHLKPTLDALQKEDSGQDLIEYCLLGSLLALAVVAATAAVSMTIDSSFSALGNQISKHAHHDDGNHFGWFK